MEKSSQGQIDRRRKEPLTSTKTYWGIHIYALRTSEPYSAENHVERKKWNFIKRRKLWRSHSFEMLGFSCFSFFCETKESKKQNITYCLPLLTRLPESLRHHLSQIALLKSKSGQTDFPSNNSRPFSLCKVAQYFVLKHHNSFMRITMPCPVSCLSVVYLSLIHI